MQLAFDYAHAIGSLRHEQRLYFYEVLAHELTISVRAIWSDEDLSDVEKIERMRWVNEIMHRVVRKISVLRKQTHEWTEESSWKDIEAWVSQCPAVAGVVKYAIEFSYRCVISSSDTYQSKEVQQ